jgi:hypothetical protein
MRDKAEKLAFLHGSDDPYCPVEQAVTLATKLKSPLMLIPGGQHLGANLSQFPQLWQVLAPEL